jgi:hypothetical protein
MDLSGIRKHLRLPCVLVALVLLADVLFFRHTLGWMLGIYGVVVALALMLRARPRFHAVMIKIFYILLIPAIALIWRTDWVTLVVLYVMLLALAVAAGGGAPATISAWPLALARFPIRFLHYLERRLKRMGKARLSIVKRLPSGVLHNWIVPIALTLLFVILFSVANPVFFSWIQHGVCGCMLAPMV